MTHLIPIIIAAVLSNFAYQGYFTATPDYAVALDRSYFQVLGITYYHLYLKFQGALK